MCGYCLDDQPPSKEQILSLTERIKHLEQTHEKNYTEINNYLEKLNEKIYRLSESFGEILLSCTAEFNSQPMNQSTGGAADYTLSPTASATGPSAMPI
jgi:DNA anti-recombination protein RmuC